MEGLVKLKYPNEPVRFGKNEIEPFMIWAVENGTSDVTVQNEEQIFCEIHGKMIRVTDRRLTRSELVEIISAIYKSDGAVSKLNGGEDVDLPWVVKVSREKELRFRVNMTAILTEGHTGYQITIRTITNRAPALETLNLPQPIIENMSKKQGLIIIAGATGSGKSTLLASILDYRMRQEDSNLKILTYEAPIEYVYDDVPKPSSSIAQTEIGRHLGSFALGVRNALRRKPSIILMGEMRDEETIGEGVTASMTGHLVYGTLHTNGVPDAVRRMVNVFPAEEKNARAYDILGSLKLVVAQMLIPSIDGKRVALREYLVFSQDIVDTLLEGGVNDLTYNCRKQLVKHGQTFLMDARSKYEQGLISEHWYNEIKSITEVVEKDVSDSHAGGA